MYVAVPQSEPLRGLIQAGLNSQKISVSGSTHVRAAAPPVRPEADRHAVRERHDPAAGDGVRFGAGLGHEGAGGRQC